jgi:hypothetical protein
MPASQKKHQRILSIKRKPAGKLVVMDKDYTPVNHTDIKPFPLLPPLNSLIQDT